MTLDRRLIAGLAILLAAISFFAITIAANNLFPAARLDLTDNGLYTLSPGTRAVLSKLEDPITLRLYYSARKAQDFASLRAHAQRVRDLLREYVALSGGKLIFTEIDPDDLRRRDREAATEGLIEAPTDANVNVFFGLVGTNTLDGREVVTFFRPEREEFLEYELTALIQRLNLVERPRLGLVSNLPLDTGPGGIMAALQGRSQPFYIYEQLVQDFAIEFLEQSFARVPDHLTTLMIAHPRDLDETTLYAIDQFALRGGKILVFVDPISEISQLTQQPGQTLEGATMSSDLPRLLAAWGVAYDRDLVAADRLRALPVRFGNSPQPVPYVLWMGLQANEADDLNDFNRSDPTTASLTLVNLGTAGFLTPIEGATTSFTPLVQTSFASMQLPADLVRQQSDPPALLDQFLPSGERLTLAARISGPAKSAFPDGPPKPPEPPPAEGAEAEPPDEARDAAPEEEDAAPPPETAPHLAESQGPINVVVVADSDLFDDRFWVQIETFQGQRFGQKIADNSDFVINLVQNMQGSNDLISLRTRQSSRRPFTVVEDLKRDAETRFRAELERLQAARDDTLRRIDALQRETRPGESVILSPEQEAEIANFETELAKTEDALDDIGRLLQSDVSALERLLTAVNIGLMPLAVLGIAGALAVLRGQRRRSRASG